MAIYQYNKNRKPTEQDLTVYSVNHRGYNTIAPENTLPAFKLSKQMGFDYVETDVQFTSDNVPVLLHDSTINRTSNGTGNISQMTFEQVRQYDFGSWKSSEYAGTKIPSLAEFLYLCKCLMLYPYIEIKSDVKYTNEQLIMIVDMVNRFGMSGKVTYISFSSNYLTVIKNYDDSARLGYLRANYSNNDIAVCKSLKTNKNNVFYDVSYSVLTSEIINAFIAEKIPIEIWTVDDANYIRSMDGYITGVTSNSLIAGTTLYSANLV